MANAIWNGVISFGLLNIPVALRSGERSTDLHFRMLDSRDNNPIRFERVNSETGEEVPWKEIVKAFEYEKGNYVVLQQEDFKAAAPDSLETVEIQSFVDREAINPMHYEKPYYLVPAKKAEKGYVLLREVLRTSNRIALGKVVIRTREYLCGVMPMKDALVMLLLRFPQEIVSPEEFMLPAGGLGQYRISEREVAMAEQLVESMTIDFDPSVYVDDFRTRLQEVIDTRIRAQEGTVTKADADGDDEEESASTNVVDFMSLLRKSLDGRKPGSGEAAPGNASKGAKPSPSVGKSDSTTSAATSARAPKRGSSKSGTTGTGASKTASGKTGASKVGSTGSGSTTPRKPAAKRKAVARKRAA